MWWIVGRLRAPFGMMGQSRRVRNCRTLRTPRRWDRFLPAAVGERLVMDACVLLRNSRTNALVSNLKMRQAAGHSHSQKMLHLDVDEEKKLRQ